MREAKIEGREEIKLHFIIAMKALHLIRCKTHTLYLPSLLLILLFSI